MKYDLLTNLQICKQMDKVAKFMSFTIIYQHFYAYSLVTLSSPSLLSNLIKTTAINLSMMKNMYVTYIITPYLHILPRLRHTSMLMLA